MEYMETEITPGLYSQVVLCQTLSLTFFMMMTYDSLFN